MRVATRPSLSTVLFPFLFAPLLSAQRSEPTLEWQKHSTTISYGAVPVGKHSLAELPVGQSWRLGMNQATTWRTELPLLFGERAVPPGEYRLTLERRAEQRCAVVLHGTSLAIETERDLAIEGDIGAAKTPSKKLDIVFEKAKPDQELLPATLKVTFGGDEWSAPLQLVGGSTSKVGGYQLTTFALPAATVKARKQHPATLAVLKKGSGKNVEAWNLVVTDAEARLVPWIDVPEAQFGFGQIPSPDTTRVSLGTVSAAAKRDDAPSRPLLRLNSSDLDDGRLTLQFAAGDEVLTVDLPEPPKKK